jgi:hypothetical protein
MRPPDDEKGKTRSGKAAESCAFGSTNDSVQFNLLDIGGRRPKMKSVARDAK